MNGWMESCTAWTYIYCTGCGCVDRWDRIIVLDWLDAGIFVEDLIHEGGTGERGDGEQEKMSRRIMADDREKDEKPDSVWVKGHEGVGWMITI